MGKITYTNKVALNENPEVADINKVTDDDMNEIKSVVNTNDDNVGDITTLTTTTKTSTVSAINELNSTKATSNDVGNIENLTTTDKTNVVNAVNELNSDKASKNEVIISDTQPSASDNKIWIDTGEIGSQVSEITNEYSTSIGLGYSANYVNNLHTYSTDEIRIGTWISGKPLYRKVFDVGNLPNATLKQVPTNLTNISCKHLYGYAVGTGVGTAVLGYTMTLPFVHTSNVNNGVSIRYDGSNNNNNIDIVTGIDQSGYVGYVVMEYTKTTD